MFFQRVLALLSFAGAFAVALSSAVSDPVPGLKELLSPDAELYIAGSPEYEIVFMRWSAAVRPEFDVIVTVKTESDVQKTIQYANEQGKPFLAISGGHGTSVNLGKVRNGIGILMTGMNHVQIVDDGQAAVVGGGISTGQLTHILWENGKQTVTPGCDCVGFVSPLIGGGHGWLQGQYGLATDQLISARMVLANGTAITVSEESYPDLFWGIRGAGHNFGIYTELKIKIYDRSPTTDLWTVMTLTYTQEKLEDVFAIGNEWLESSDPDVRLTQYGLFYFNPSLDANNPVFNFYIYWQGSDIPSEYSDPLQALGPSAVTVNTTELGDVNAHLGAKYGGAACARGYSRVIYAISQQSWSLENMRETLNIFGKLPEEFRNSVVLLEGYALNGVLAKPEESTAYPDRQGRILIGPLLTYANNASLDATAFDFGSRMRSALVDGTGQPLSAYVNYAHGDESVEEIYGHETWRLERLRSLKQEYDPDNKFGFFAPIR
ncbi:FAD-binding domain-containing protein [Westerdykella ornata]|uniref:FAD-binding domain-containing protein n=1 Tax=Westerdykella ornata TaxID=318751 RepID=A0A6A6JFK2_WESOR|nr:FAD-binding domain-containing protein [Westerdykella ornata]KAF2275331.1 FAD-binding domain-containing protein [Westerdykella ornata]